MQLVLIREPCQVDPLGLYVNVFVYCLFTFLSALGHGEICQATPLPNFDSQKGLDFVQRCTLSEFCAKPGEPRTALAAEPLLKALEPHYEYLPLVFHEMSDMSLNRFQGGSAGVHST
jgi:hypothetical protein